MHFSRLNLCPFYNRISSIPSFDPLHRANILVCVMQIRIKCHQNSGICDKMSAIGACSFFHFITLNLPILPNYISANKVEKVKIKSEWTKENHQSGCCIEDELFRGILVTNRCGWSFGKFSSEKCAHFHFQHLNHADYLRDIIT